MGATESTERRVVVPHCPYLLGAIAIITCAVLLFLLNARASALDTISSALGLYSAALLGVFSILTSWRGSIIKRRHRYQDIEDKWRRVIDRSVLFALRGSAISFAIMLFSVIAPAVKDPIFLLVPTDIYALLARGSSSLALSGVVLLGLMSLQIVRDVTAVYEWNNHIEEQDAKTQAERDALDAK